MERKRREWDEQVMRKDTVRLVKILRDAMPAGESSPGRPKRRWSNLISV